MQISQPRASESNHWYTRDGIPRYTVTGKNGQQRNTTLRDARIQSLVPSVTTILNTAAKPALTAWLMNQVLMAALTLPKRADEADEDYCKRIVQDSKEQGRAAADAGTDIHAAVQGYYEGQVVRGHEKAVEGCVEAIKAAFGVQPWIAERAFGHELGFGGKSDLYAPARDGFDGIVLDIKTKEFSDPAKVDAYDEHLMQVAAYRVGLGVPKARCGNVFVSRSVPGLAVVKEWSAEDLDRGWKMFVHLLNFWQLKNGHE
jgi:hypothetical protein